MRRLLLSWAILTALVATGGEARGDRRGVVVARTDPGGVAAVYASARKVWRASSSDERVITPVRWSRRGDAIAFATSSDRFITLVVVLVGGDADGHVMRWPVPSSPRRGDRAAVTWLGSQRVAFGRSEVRPDVVASWQLRQ